MKRLFNICLVIALHAIILTSCDLLFPYSVEDAPAPEDPNPDIPVVEEKDTNSVALGKFSIGVDKLVQFSPGNLKYYKSVNKWDFAYNQLSCDGDCEYDIVSLFSWGTGDNPTKHHFGDFNKYIDWGINKIGNDKPRTWRALTNDEWEYILSDRPNADNLKGAIYIMKDGSFYAQGWILLPDTWVCPAGLNFTAGSTGEYSTNVYLLDEWKVLEASGAVFFPNKGMSSLNIYSNCHTSGRGKTGHYWTASERDGDEAYYVYFSSSSARMTYTDRSHGLSVRLVKDL